MIPKVIHYCWFGGNEKSQLIKNCMKSWREYCPDYKIVEWNEGNFDIQINAYVEEAYRLKKWAYVSDYVRFYVLYNNGGIYLDTDVQLLKPIDTLVEKGNFDGFANDRIVNTGLIMCCEKGDWLCKEVLDSYRGEAFVWNDDPSKMFAIGRRVTSILKLHGLAEDGTLQNIGNYTIYPKYYFNPTDGDMNVKIDERAFSVHHFAATWFPLSKKIKNSIRRFIGHRRMEQLKNLFSFLRRD